MTATDSRKRFERWAIDDLDLDTFANSDEYADPDRITRIDPPRSIKTERQK